MTEETIPVGKDRHYRLLTKEELHDTALERVEHISKEFTAGFDFLSDYPKSVTFFGGTHITPGGAYYEEARVLAERIVTDLDYSVVTGGGPGIMEAANRGAFEAGGKSIGLYIELMNQKGHNNYLTNSLEFYYFFSRKVCLAFSAEAYIFFPGGFGTLDEFSEILTLIQTKKIEQVPVILVGSDFWKPLHEFMKREMLGRNTIEEQDLSLYTISDDVEAIIEMIRSTPVRNGIPKHARNIETVPLEEPVPAPAVAM